MIVYRTAKHVPGSEAFRQAVVNYVKTVIDVEWAEMGKDAMSPEAIGRFEDIWNKFYELKDNGNKMAHFTLILRKPAGSAPPGSPPWRAIFIRRSG